MTRLRIAVLVASLAIMGGVSACRKGSDADPSWAGAPLPSESSGIDGEMADAGASLFRANCSACHYIGGDDTEAGLGPNLAGVTRRRDVGWIRAMIANPDSMLERDSIAAGLYDEYGIRMLNVGATPAEVRALMEFLWRADRGSAGPERADRGGPADDGSSG